MVPEMSADEFVQSNWTATVWTGFGPGVKTYWSTSIELVAELSPSENVPVPHVVLSAETVMVAEKVCPPCKDCGGTIMNEPPSGPGPFPYCRHNWSVGPVLQFTSSG